VCPPKGRERERDMKKAEEKDTHNRKREKEIFLLLLLRRLKRTNFYFRSLPSLIYSLKLIDVALKDENEEEEGG